MITFNTSTRKTVSHRECHAQLWNIRQYNQRTQQNTIIPAITYLEYTIVKKRGEKRGNIIIHMWRGKGESFWNWTWRKEMKWRCIDTKRSKKDNLSVIQTTERSLIIIYSWSSCSLHVLIISKFYLSHYFLIISDFAKFISI